MYASKVQNRKLTFGVSGMLWDHSLVMYDAETESYWSHILGKSMYGEMKGERLESVACVMTDWAAWYAKYPDTSVLWMSYTSDVYASNMPIDWNRLLLGIEIAGKPYAWSYQLLKEKGSISTVVEGVPVFVVMDTETLGARVFDRRVNGQTLELRMEEDRVVAADSQQNWDPVSGRSPEGVPLTALPTVPSFRGAWQSFHPESVVFESTAEDPTPSESSTGDE